MYVVWLHSETLFQNQQTNISAKVNATQLFCKAQTTLYLYNL